MEISKELFNLDLYWFFSCCFINLWTSVLKLALYLPKAATLQRSQDFTYEHVPSCEETIPEYDDILYRLHVQ